MAYTCMHMHVHCMCNMYYDHHPILLIFCRITCCRLHHQSHTHHKSSPALPILLLAYADCLAAIHQFKELTQDISERELMFENYLTELA